MKTTAGLILSGALLFPIAQAEAQQQSGSSQLSDSYLSALITECGTRAPLDFPRCRDFMTIAGSAMVILLRTHDECEEVHRASDDELKKLAVSAARKAISLTDDTDRITFFRAGIFTTWLKGLPVACRDAIVVSPSYRRAFSFPEVGSPAP